MVTPAPGCYDATRKVANGTSPDSEHAADRGGRVISVRKALMRARLRNRCRIGRHSLVYEVDSLVAGNPARVVRDLRAGEESPER